MFVEFVLLISSKTEAPTSKKLINCWSTCWILRKCWSIVEEHVDFPSECWSTIDQLVDSNRDFNLLINFWSTFSCQMDFGPQCWSTVDQHVESQPKKQHVDQLLINKLNCYNQTGHQNFQNCPPPLSHTHTLIHPYHYRAVIHPARIPRGKTSWKQLVDQQLINMLNFPLPPAWKQLDDQLLSNMVNYESLRPHTVDQQLINILNYDSKNSPTCCSTVDQHVDFSQISTCWSTVDQ